MADAMDVDSSQPRQFRLVKASGDAHVARLPPSLGARLFDDARAQLTEELESDVSEDEQDPDAKPNFRRRRRRFRGRKLRQSASVEAANRTFGGGCEPHVGQEGTCKVS